MKNFIPIFLLLFGALFLFSCDSKRTDEGDLLFGLNDTPISDDPPTSTEHTKLLSKYVFTSIDGYKTTATFTYSAGVLISSKLVEEEEETTTNFSLVYNGSALSQINITSDDGTGVVEIKLPLHYENGKLISANGTVGSGTETLPIENLFQYNASGKLVKAVTNFKGPSMDNPDEMVTFNFLESNLQYSGNNLSYWKLTTGFPPVGPITIPPIVIETTFSNYDTNKNPFNSLPEVFNIATAHFTSSSVGPIGISKNNFKKMNVLAMGVTQAANYAYEFDGAGYPTKGTTEQGTITYEYIPR